ncbi:MAG: sigma 54-interacting transcriptional regulator [Planctomycetota bacterium]
MTSLQPPIRKTLPPPDAYLVIDQGSRWSDVYRLAGIKPVLLGRASDCDVVLKSERASRRHARIAPKLMPGAERADWVLEDLGSRNGITLNGGTLTGPHRLRPGDRIAIGGFGVQFTNQLDRVGGAAVPVARASDLAKQATSEDLPHLDQDDPESWQASEIIDSFQDLALESSSESEAGDKLDAAGVSSAIPPALAFALELGRVEDVESLREQLMRHLARALPGTNLGLFEFPSSPGGGGVEESTLELPPPVAILQQSDGRYRRPPDVLLQQVWHRQANAILARNVAGDATLAPQNSQGEFDVESMILVPIVAADAKPKGLIHGTTGIGAEPLKPSQLRFAVTAGRIYAGAMQALQRQNELSRSLRHSQAAVANLRQQLQPDHRFLGDSRAMQFVRQQIDQVARSNAAVLVRGESGVGKELVTSAIHHTSERRDGPLVCLNCAALSRDLLESELFGHEAGAFTGATNQKAGKFEAAHGGTLMLDEIGEMDLDLQAKLLRVIEGHRFERVGGNESLQADVRVIAATHRDLAAMVAKNQFRQDLYYRLHVIEIVVPPLRERTEDIVPLARGFIQELSRSMGRPPLRLSAATRKKLRAYHWPGNVRELRNVIERAIVMTPLKSASGELDERTFLLSSSSAAPSTPTDSAKPLSLAELEAGHIRKVLAHTNGNKSRAASILGIERSTLDRKLKRLAAQTQGE